MMEEIDRFQVPPVNGETQPLDPAASSTSEADPDTRESLETEGSCQEGISEEWHCGKSCQSAAQEEFQDKVGRAK
ncbi:hypothetical protein KUCAC02_031278 [Chaenocephalus aceratus]|uniref:Uncharacterized protein n=1 Tax=Chaenocephalus aceratus TaxID=36190 RepID=A0ACB9XN31_CHAAC|nr:hypothetical protein KUCAC02_031278 [Chaenocephalus aceratus]